ncbi:MAG: hypothetical protein JJU25_18105 [Halomonas sp.]|nr:hypothetical protein [Halomonas sp.]
MAEGDIRRIQIRETIKAHLDKEKQLHAQGIKVLSLFFIDEVVKYRDYAQADERGQYARIFEEEYLRLKEEALAELALEGGAYRTYLSEISAASTHQGYFSIDRKSRRLKDPSVGTRSLDSDDVDAYDLILKDKERLLSLAEPTRFIFSHSALREGWDNPNVFVLCMLKHSDNAISRRQEVGRGLRLCVNQQGERMDNPAVVHEINELTVVASESYTDFVTGLQQEIAAAITERLSDSDMQLPRVEDGRKPKTNPLNANFDKQEFQALWQRINRKAVYRVEFDSDELIRQCIQALDSQLRVAPLQYIVQRGSQKPGMSDEALRKGEGFAIEERTTERARTASSQVKYDLLGKVAESAQLTRRTVAEIFQGIQPAVFNQFKHNPEQFITEASRLIHEQKATIVLQRLRYEELEERYHIDIFTAAQSGQDFSRATARLNKHVYDYAITDSDIERRLVQELEVSADVVAYAKLPRGFLIPTPVGDYNPDWAICFREGSVRHLYFVAETKGGLPAMTLREIERVKVECARKFFDEIGRCAHGSGVKYEVVTDFDTLMDQVGQPTRA